MKIDIPKPCQEEWFAMTPGEQLRFCGICRQNVIDVAAMSESEAIIAVSEPETCARIEFNSQGRIKTRSGFSSTLLLAAGLSMACSGSQESQKTDAMEGRTVETTETQQQADQTKPQEAPPTTKPSSVDEDSIETKPVRVGKVRIKDSSRNKSQR